MNGREPERKFTSPLRKMRALCFHVPYPEKPWAADLKPVFDGFCINIDKQYCGTITVMTVSDRSEAWTVYEKMSKCPFAWLYGYWMSLGYVDGMVRSTMEGLGSNTYIHDQVWEQL